MNPAIRIRSSSPFLPTSAAEMAARGWDYVDVVFVTGDAYVDHPSFAMAIIGRVLEAEGYRVVILSQPDWRNCEPWKQFGKPRLFFGVSAGNMDSLINHYTANKKVRNDDAYSPGGKIGLRPDRATLSYCQRAREAFPGVPVIAGGVEASLRRLAHYDYWSDTVKRSILLDAKADLIVYGMGERPVREIAKRLAVGASVKELRDIRGVAYALGAREEIPTEVPQSLRPLSGAARDNDDFKPVLVPSFESVKADKDAFLEATRLIHTHTNPFNAKVLVQTDGERKVVINPPDLPLSQAEMDRIYDLPYSRLPHPSYAEKIPAFEMIKDSVTIMRGCFGGCTFCSITTHQGRTIQSRSQESILREVKTMGASPSFKGVLSDIGGPTANMYEMRCTAPEVEKSCRRLSCVHPNICPLLGTSHNPLKTLMRKVRTTPGIKKVFVASGIRMDLAQLDNEYLEELAAHHVGGLLKVAPEHASDDVLGLMKKPSIDNFTAFAEGFNKASKKVGKEQYLVPYFIGSHPGSTLESMIELAVYLKRNGYKPDQVQDFIPAPFDIATCMYYTGRDPFTKKEVPVAKKLNDRKMQKALMQFFKPENYFEVRDALERANRFDLIGNGCDALIPSQPPREALQERRQRATRDVARREERDMHHRIPTPSEGGGYRPGRASHQRRDRTDQRPPNPYPSNSGPRP